MSDTSEYRPLEGLPLPVAVLRAERLVYANPALSALLGASAEELSQLSMVQIFERFLPEERPWVQPRYESRTRGERPPGSELWLRLKDSTGHERLCHVHVHTGTQPGEQLIVVQDMEREDTVRRLTEALVAAAVRLMHCRSEKEVLELAVDTIHQQGFYVSVLHLAGDVYLHGPVRQDPVALALGEKLYGRPIHEVQFPRGAVPHLEAVLTHRKAAFHQDIHSALEHFHAPELAAYLKRTFPNANALDAPIFVEDKPYGVLAIQGELLSPASAGTLELFANMVGSALENVGHHHEASARLAELSRLQGDLVEQERLTVLGEAAGVVAHEVRNPLGAILNVAAVLKREPQLSAIGTSAVAMLEEEVTRLDDIVRDLLDVVRPFEPRPKPLHLGELARRVVDLLHPVCESTGARIAFDEPEELPLLQGDETLLQLALSNLLRYALRSSPPGGTVRLAISSVPGGLCAVMEDQGAGLSGVDSQRVFEPFFTSRATGAGLGLAVVRRVVLAHGGKVGVSERAGGGARFEVFLPVGERG